jgi:hypothetical protein
MVPDGGEHAYFPHPRNDQVMVIESFRDIVNGDEVNKQHMSPVKKLGTALQETCCRRFDRPPAPALPPLRAGALSCLGIICTQNSLLFRTGKRYRNRGAMGVRGKARKRQVIPDNFP